MKVVVLASSMGTRLLQNLRGSFSSPLANRLLKGTFWSLVGALVSRFLALVLSIFIARMLGQQEFGEFGIIQSTVGMFGAIAGFGLGLTNTKYIAEFRKSDPSKAGRIVAFSTMFSFMIGGIASILLFFAAPWLAEQTLAAPWLSHALRIGSLLILVNAINGMQIGALSGFEVFTTIAKINLVSGIVTVPLVLLGIRINGLAGAIWGTVIAGVFSCILCHIILERVASRHGISIKYSQWHSEISLLLAFSLPAAVYTALYSPATWVGNAILVNQNKGYAEMAIFNAANQWRLAVLFLPNVVALPMLPILANISADGSARQYKKALLVTILLTSFLTIIPGGIIALLSKQIMGAYGSAFLGGSMTLIWIIVATIIAAPGIGVIQAIITKGRQWHNAMIHIVWVMVFIASCFVFRHRGSEGIAFSYVVSYSVQTMLFIIYLKTVILRKAMDLNV